jgi:hypothetical protein
VAVVAGTFVWKCPGSLSRLLILRFMFSRVFRWSPCRMGSGNATTLCAIRAPLVPSRAVLMINKDRILFWAVSGQESIPCLSKQLAELSLSVVACSRKPFKSARSHIALICERICAEAGCSPDTRPLLPGQNLTGMPFPRALLVEGIV